MLRDDVPLALPPGPFDTLLYLVENAGRVVERDELLRAVWGGRVVEEANTNQTIFALRKALHMGGADDRFIVTAPTRGYRFAAPVPFETDPIGAPDDHRALVEPLRRPSRSARTVRLAGAVGVAKV